MDCSLYVYTYNIITKSCKIQFLFCFTVDERMQLLKDLKEVFGEIYLAKFIQDDELVLMIINHLKACLY